MPKNIFELLADHQCHSGEDMEEVARALVRATYGVILVGIGSTEEIQRGKFSDPDSFYNEFDRLLADAGEIEIDRPDPTTQTFHTLSKFSKE